MYFYAWLKIVKSELRIKKLRPVCICYNLAAFENLSCYIFMSRKLCTFVTISIICFVKIAFTNYQFCCEKIYFDIPIIIFINKYLLYSEEHSLDSVRIKQDKSSNRYDSILQCLRMKNGLTLLRTGGVFNTPPTESQL